MGATRTRGTVGRQGRGVGRGSRSDLLPLLFPASSATRAADDLRSRWAENSKEKERSPRLIPLHSSLEWQSALLDSPPDFSWSLPSVSNTLKDFPGRRPLVLQSQKEGQTPFPTPFTPLYDPLRILDDTWAALSGRVGAGHVRTERHWAQTGCP